MIERERKRVQETGKEAAAEIRALTPSEEARRKNNERLSSILPVPELKPINPEPTRLKMNGSPKTLFETIVKVFGGPSFNVIWDPDYQPQVKGNVTVDFDHPLPSQLIFTLVSPQGRRVRLANRSLTLTSPTT